MSIFVPYLHSALYNAVQTGRRETTKIPGDKLAEAVCYEL